MQLTAIDPASASSLQSIVAASVLCLLVLMVLYVWVAVGLARVFDKLGEPTYKAWVPVLAPMTVLRLGGYSAVWVIPLLMQFVPFIGLAGAVVFFVAVHSINRQFGRGAGSTVLAVILYPVWTSVLGFGTARPLGGLPADAAAALNASAFDARMAGFGIAPDVAVTPALRAPAPASSPGALAAPLPTPLSPDGLPVGASPAAPLPAAPFSPAAPPSVPAAAWAPPLRPAEPQPQFAPLAPSNVDTSDTDPSDTDPSDIDPTIVKRRGPVYSLRTADGTDYRLVGTLVLIGRNPASSAADPGAMLLTIPDATKTASKTHARLRLTDQGWTITDFGSTNGTVIFDEQGVEREVGAGESALIVRTLRIGQLALTLIQEP